MKQTSLKKKILIICSIVIVLALILNVGVLLLDITQKTGGVITGISAVSRGKDRIVLKLGYVLPMGLYSVYNVPEDEGEYTGDGMIDYDGSLGKYRIVIYFGDDSLSTALVLRILTNNNTIKNSPVKLKIKTASPSDHGFALYVGSDTPIYVEEMNACDMNEICGTIRIPIMLGENKKN